MPREAVPGSFEIGKNGLLAVAYFKIVAFFVIAVFAVEIAGPQIGGAKNAAFNYMVLKQVRHVYLQRNKPETH